MAAAAAARGLWSGLARVACRPRPGAAAARLPPLAAARGVRCMSAGSPDTVYVQEEAGAGDAGPARYRQIIRTGPHVLAGDLAPQSSGRDLGPSPKEYVMIGLASCTSMTARIYADAKQWPLRRVSVRVRERLPSPGAHLPLGLSVAIELEGPALSEAQRQRILAAVAKCPVKRMLSGELAEGIATELLPAGGSIGGPGPGDYAH